MNKDRDKINVASERLLILVRIKSIELQRWRV